MRKKAIVFALTLGMLLSLAFPPSAFAEGNQVLRVGFFSFPGYHMIDEDGRRSGYGYEFLQRLAAHGDWTYEYLGYGVSYGECLNMLRRGEVDIVTSVSKTPEREREFLFSRQSIGTNSTIMTVRAGNTAVREGDYSTYDGLTVGMLEDNSKNDNFARFASEKGFSYVPSYFEDEAGMAAALKDGQVDALVTGSLRKLDGEWLIESFDASPFYIVTLKDNPALMEKIDKAIAEMDMQDPNWRETLHTAYYASGQSGEILMTAEEREYLEKLREEGPLTVMFNPQWAPYAYFEGDEGAGILPAVFERAAEKLGIPWEYVRTSGPEEYYERRSKEDIDLIIDFAGDYYTAESEGYKITDPYFSTNFARLTRTGFEGSAEKIGIVRHADAIRAYLRPRVEEERLVYYSTAADCVEGLGDGEVDAAYLYSYTAEQAVRNDPRGRFSSRILGSTSLSFAVSGTLPEGQHLLSLLDKAVSSLGATTIDAIVEGALAKDRDTDISLMNFIYRNPAYGVAATAVLLLLLFTAVMLFQRTRNQRELKRQVEQATAQLQTRTEELSEALEAANAANRAKTTFLNNMSHDIRTPMNAIIGYTALTASHLDNEERARDYLNKIGQASSHLLSLINDVLDMSRIEAGKVTIEERPENLADILQGLRNIIQSDIHAKGLELYIDTVDVTNEEIYCDRLRVNQILLNLTSNAIKFTPAGGKVAVTVTQRPKSDSSGEYEFKVSDTGIGMSPEFQKTVFDPFTRERTSTVSGIQGTGLGMAITKNIVDMMNGTIEVESEPGKGTTFTVKVEFRYASAQASSAPIEALQGLRGLVVDDDLVSCQSVSKMLRQVGMRAEWTLSGKEAVVRTAEAIELSDPFEVYIIDWSMPDMNGVETVRQIRSIIGEESPIILMSAYDWSDIEQEARAAGVSGFVSKPLFASDLHKALERGLGIGSAAPEQQENPMEKGSFAGRRLLLAEDNELNREIAVEILSEAGFLVDTAENGQQAVEMAQKASEGTYELILMDIQMPIMDGYEATRRIRALDAPAASLPIIAMTANAFEEDKSMALEAGMDGYLSKPIDLDALHSILARFLGGDGGGRK